MGITRDATLAERRAYHTAWRRKNPGYYKTEKQKAKTRANLAIFRARWPDYFKNQVKMASAVKRELVWRIKAERGCQDCGIKDPVVLDFDHRDPATKNTRLRNGIGGFHHLSSPDLRAEINKCDVVCANCHRRRTARAQGWTYSTEPEVDQNNAQAVR